MWVVKANGGPAVQITPFVAGEDRARPWWSQDGTRLTYFVMNVTEGRIGVGITRDVIPLALQTRTWRAMKKGYR